MEIGLVSVLLGAGRNTVDEAVDFSSGVMFHKRPGMLVEKGDVLATVYTERQAVLENSVLRVKHAFAFSDSRVSLLHLITHFVTKDSVEDFDQSIIE